MVIIAHRRCGIAKVRHCGLCSAISHLHSLTSHAVSDVCLSVNCTVLIIIVLFLCDVDATLGWNRDDQLLDSRCWFYYSISAWFSRFGIRPSELPTDILPTIWFRANADFGDKVLLCLENMVCCRLLIATPLSHICGSRLVGVPGGFYPTSNVRIRYRNWNLNVRDIIYDN